MIHRIKTQQEFENEYGPRWRTLVPAHFPQEMDVLLGQRVIVPQSCLRDDGKAVISFSGKSEYFPYCKAPMNVSANGIHTRYTITKEMIVEEHRAEKVSKIVDKISKENMKKQEVSRYDV